MSEVKLNLVDRQTILAGTIHGSVGDACVAALTAEPETIAELETGLARYIKPDERSSRFASFRAQSEIDSDPHDAGLVIIDLAARVVAVESTYSQPGPEGVVHYHNGKHATDIPIRYVLDSDWLFVNSAESYRWSAERRRAERLTRPPIDMRAILYGRPLLEFIREFEAGLRQKGFTLPPRTEAAADAVAGEIVKGHARWLTTPRDDLRGSAPRDVILEKLHFIDMDMDSRAFQWTMQGEGPPGLPRNSFAYRYAGFGTHEWVVYYYLVRHLFCLATLGDRISTTTDVRSASRQVGIVDGSTNVSESPSGPRSRDDMRSVPSAVADGSVGSSQVSSDAIRIRTGSGSDRVAALVSETQELAQTGDMRSVPFAVADGSTTVIDLLERLKSDWLERPRPNYDGRIPALIIENERRRLPITMTPEQLMIDEDCECCQMLARDAAMGAPTFWHLDGCNMEEEFAFSPCLTIQEWEAENQRQEELALEFARRDAERRDWDRRWLDPDRELQPDDWQPVQLNSHEMAELLEQMKITPSRHFDRAAEEDEVQAQLERNEPIN